MGKRAVGSLLSVWETLLRKALQAAPIQGDTSKEKALTARLRGKLSGQSCFRPEALSTLLLTAGSGQL